MLPRSCETPGKKGDAAANQKKGKTGLRSAGTEEGIIHTVGPLGVKTKKPCLLKESPPVRCKEIVIWWTGTTWASQKGRTHPV